ncbi:MAG: AtpZ/AtpI family protein [Candidatus Nanopelagicus sp.]|jgi:ATP synthase protein I|nr:AtpZ/AtpI family protein [Candidatus Nanopelagicus sp.]
MSRSKSNNDDINNSQNEENALWSIVGYLLSGLMIWGGIGWGLDRWLGTTYLVLVGMLLGAGSSIYLVWLRFGRD